MFSPKALLALSTIGLGAAALGVAVYVSANPRAFTTESSPASVYTEPLPKPPGVIDPPPQDITVEIPAVSVIAQPKAKAKPRVAPRAVHKAAPLQKCADWRGLENGREGRRVRELCPPKAKPPRS